MQQHQSWALSWNGIYRAANLTKSVVVVFKKDKKEGWLAGVRGMIWMVAK